MIHRGETERNKMGRVSVVITAEQTNKNKMPFVGIFSQINREVKFDVYGKRQTANDKLLPSVFSSLYSRIKIFVFAVNSKRHFSIFL